MFLSKNIPVSVYRDALTILGLERIRTSNNHEVWTKKEMQRPVIFNAIHIEVPEMQVLSNCRTLGLSIEDFLDKINQE